VAVSPVNGDIVVTDFERHTVVFFDKNGRFLTLYSGDDDDDGAECQKSRHNGAVQRKLKVRYLQCSSLSNSIDSIHVGCRFQPL